MITNESSIITRLFEGQLSYSIICLKCENCTYKNEVFTVISLPIPSEYECSLQVRILTLGDFFCLSLPQPWIFSALFPIFSSIRGATL